MPRRVVYRNADKPIEVLQVERPVLAEPCGARDRGEAIEFTS